MLNRLPDQIYVNGETSGNVAAMIAAEAKAVDEIRQYIASGATAGLSPWIVANFSIKQSLWSCRPAPMPTWPRKSG